MMNSIWVGMMIFAVICGALTGNLGEVAKASTDSAKSAVTLALGLVGVMAFWLGMMRILRQGGLLKSLAHALKPIWNRFINLLEDYEAFCG